MNKSVLKKLLPGLLALVFATTVNCLPSAAQQQQRPCREGEPSKASRYAIPLFDRSGQIQRATT
jgi:hypothetical protein